MPRTKRRFEDVSASTSQNKPESNEAVENEEEEEEQEPPNNNVLSRGGGKMFVLQRPGKQIRTIEEQEDDSDDEDSSTPVYRGGKYLRPVGGKQLNIPPVANDSSEEEEEEEEKDEEPAVTARPMGKSLMNMQRGGGKQFRPAFLDDDDDDDDDSDSDDEDEQEVKDDLPVARLGSGKILSPPTSMQPIHRNTQVDDDDDDDMDFDANDDKAMNLKSQADNKTTAVKKSVPPAANKKNHSTKNATLSQSKSLPAKKSALKKLMVEESDEEEDKDDIEDEEEEEEEQDDVEEEDDEAGDLDPNELEERHLIKGDADQEYLDSLPELEREEILAQRYEKLKNELEMKKVMREQRQRERESKTPSKGKKKDSTSTKKSSITSVKKPIRNEVSLTLPKSTQKEKKAAARAAIRETRAAAKNAIDQKKLPSNRDDMASDLDYGDDDYDDSDEDYEEKPWAMKKAVDAVKETKVPSIAVKESKFNVEQDEEDEETPKPSTRTFVEADYEDYKSLTIPRRRLIRWCHEPFFENAVQKFFVRITIGRDPVTQKPLYRLSKIEEVVVKESGEYEFPPEPGKPPVKTNKYLSLSIGDAVKEKPMNLISDSVPLPDEVSAYVNHLKNSRKLRHNLLSKKESSKMKVAQEKLVTNYHYTEKDIDEAVKARKALTSTVAKIGSEKMRAAMAVQAAKQNVDESKAKVDEIIRMFLEVVDEREKSSLDIELEREKMSLHEKELNLQKCIDEERKIINAEESRKNRMKQSSKIQNWVQVNERAKAANKTADVEAYKVELEKLSIGGKGNDFDPFARRKVRPQILWDVGKDESDEKEGAVDGADANKSESKVSHEVEKAEGIISEGKERENFSDIGSRTRVLKSSEQINDVTIDEELIARSSIGQGTSHANKGLSIFGRVRKGLSLDEYLVRKAAGTL